MTEVPATSPPRPPFPPAPEAERRPLRASPEVRKEAYTMSLYVAICLLGTLIALPTHEENDAQVIAIIWGVTVGLALAHWFAFRVSATLVSGGKVHRHDLNMASGQLAGAAIVALLASIPVLVTPQNAKLEAAELTLAAFIGVVGYAVARTGGASRLRSLVYAAIVLVVAVVIAIVKNALAGH